MNFKFLALLCLVLFSCGNDDDDVQEELQNGFTYENQFYETQTLGFVWYLNNKFSIVLSNGVYDSETTYLSGNNFYFLDVYPVFSSAEGTITEGSYEFNNSGQNNTFYPVGDEVFITNASSSSNGYTGDTEAFIIGGTMNISINNNIYEIEYNFNLDNGSNIVGYYKGERDFFKDEN